METLKEGQTLFLENIDPNGARKGTSKQIVEVIVTEVKRKYFKVRNDEKWNRFEKDKFFIESMRHDGGEYSSHWQAHFSREEIEEEQLSIELGNAIKAQFRSYGKPTIPLVKLKQIAEILEIYDPYTKTIISDEKA